MSSASSLMFSTFSSTESFKFSIPAVADTAALCAISVSKILPIATVAIAPQ